MLPKQLKTWEFVKTQRHDLENIKGRGNPTDYYYQYDGYTYSPACLKFDLDRIPEPIKR